MAHRLPLSDIKFLADFHAYCLTRGDEEYNYCNASGCALAQFLKDTGRWDADEQPLGIYKPLAPRGAWFPEEGSELYLALNNVGDETFSALATRIEALLADAPRVVSA